MYALNPIHNSALRGGCAGAVLYMVDHVARHHYQCTYFVDVDLLLRYYLDA